VARSSEQLIHAERAIEHGADGLLDLLLNVEDRSFERRVADGRAGLRCERFLEIPRHSVGLSVFG